MRVYQHHRAEVTELGKDMVKLASSDLCIHQIIKHKTKPIYGVQFHPKLSTEANPDGWKILENFTSIAREYR